MSELAERRATVTVLSNTRCSVAFSYPGWKRKDSEKECTRILNLLDDALAIDTKGSHFSASVQQGLWDGRRHVFHKNDDDGTFPKGITKRVKALLREAGYRVMKTVDLRTRKHDVDELEISEDMLNGVVLREDQLRVIESCLGEGGGIAHVATGGGKTEIASAIIKALIKKRCLFLVHTKQLLTQARARIAMRLGTIEEHIGVIGDGRFEPKHITVATVQALTRVRGDTQKRVIAKYLKTIELLMLDETHHASAKTFYRLVQRIDAPWRFGFSGTPFGLADGKGLLVEAAFGPVVEKVATKELVDKGVLAKATIRIVEVKKPVLDSDLDWQSVYKEGIVLNAPRNALIAAWAARFAKKDYPTLVIVRELWHGDNLAELLRSVKNGDFPKGVPHAFVHGKMPTTEIERQKERFVEGKIKVLIASPIFGEGVDVPAVRALIIADGGQSVANVLQKIGRGLRGKKGDNRLDAVDFADSTHKWLAKHSQDRIALYESEGFKVVPA